MSLEEKKKALAAKEAEKRQAGTAALLKREEEMIDAKLKALDTYLPDQLLEVDAPFVGLMLFHTPTDGTYNQFMKTSGAIKGDLSKNSPETVEALLAQCAIYPEPKAMLEELRGKNPHAKTLIGQRLLEIMKGRMLEEGK